MYDELTNAQFKSVIDSEQLYSALKSAQAAIGETKGGMHWKTVSGRDYLYRTSDRFGTAKSLGVRSDETELLYTNFMEKKSSSKERLDALSQKMKVQAKINVAHRVGHVSNDVASICMLLEKAQLMGSNIEIIGTNAMHAYAALAGVRFSDEIMETSDVDLLWNHKSKLKIATINDLRDEGLLGILQRTDKSFKIMEKQNFRAVANSGFMVDLIRQTPTPPWKIEPDKFFEGDLVAVDIWNMKWMLGAPKISPPVIAMNGQVFSMTVPDPRAFAMFKLWLSQSDERDAKKKKRDFYQAKAVIHLIQEKLPHLKDQWSALHSFPKEVILQAERQVERQRG
jgi:hypothetical protein